MMGSKMVLAEMCSEVEGSKRMMLPCALPASGLEMEGTTEGLNIGLLGIHAPKATLPFLIHVATLIWSYEAKRATSSPVRRSHTIAVLPAS